MFGTLNPKVTEFELGACLMTSRCSLFLKIFKHESTDKNL
jgi:hypothetical protein